MTKKLPTSPDEWLEDVARAYLDAKETQPIGELMGEPIPEGNLFHLAPHVFIKFRKIRTSKRRRGEIVEGALASYVVTMSRGSGGDELKDSPLLSFVFCYLAALYVADILEMEAVESLMDMCIERRSELAALIGGGA